MKRQKMLRDQEPARKLAQHYNAITLGGALALLLMVSILFYLQFNDLRKNQMARMSSQLNDRCAALDSFLHNTTFYISQLRNKAQYHLRQPDHGEDEFLRTVVKNYEDGRYFAIDDIPSDVRATDLGNLFGLGTIESGMADQHNELHMAYSLFPLFKATHDSLSIIAQSYYQSNNHVTAIFPWKATAELLKSNPELTIESLLEGIQDLEFMRLGSVALNPEREAYWTKVYQDPAGSGLMVTHGAPIYDGDRWIGVVATDITLSAIYPFVDDMGYAGGRMLVVNHQGQVLAGSTDQGGALRGVSETLSASMLEKMDQLTDQVDVCEADGYVLTRKRVSAANWDLLFLLPKAELDRLSFFGILGFLAIVLGLITFLLGVYFVLQRRFVRPALALTDHIRAEAADGQSHVTDVPKLWRPWFQTVSDTFALKHVTANLPGAVYQLRQEPDGSTQMIFVSNAIAEMTGVAPEAFMSGAVDWLDLFAPSDAAALLEGKRKSALALDHFQYQCPLHARDGEIKWVRLSSNPRQAEGAIIWEGLILDITQKQKAEEALIASEQRLRSIMDASLFPLVVSRCSDHSVAFINDRALSMFGLSEKPQESNSGPKHWADQVRRIEILEKLDKQGKVENEEAQFVRGDGSRFWALLSAMPIHFEHETCLLFTYADITRRKELEDELKRLATTDPLTGANNRRFFLNLGTREMDRALRNGQPFSVLMLDIDYFKRINDTYGHPGGDEVLCRTVETLTRAIRTMDVLGRMGGEEFAVLLPGAQLNTALSIAERLRESAKDMKVDWDGDKIRFTISIGVACFRKGDQTLDDIMNRADKALYDAKSGGRNRVATRDLQPEAHSLI